MKISRTSSPQQPSATGKATNVGGASGKGFAAKLGAAKTESVNKGAQAAGKAEKARQSVDVSDLGAELKSGRLTPQAAIDKVIERVLDSQVGPKAGAAVREKLGASLRESLADDPMLAAKVRALVEE